MEQANETISYHYIFAFGDGTNKQFRIELDPATLNCVQTVPTMAPEWARLDYSKCDNCGLDSSKAEFCPVAVSIADLVGDFKDMVSYHEVDVLVVTKDRNVGKHTSVQEGMSSVLGIYMVTNGCPSMEKLKPMVRFHLPFASIEETAYRAASMYLLSQYFRKNDGMEADWELRGLARIYQEIEGVNAGMLKRIQKASNEDANLNALVSLNVFAQMMPYLIEEALDSIEYLFAPYKE